jgi:hypothetical protein
MRIYLELALSFLLICAVLAQAAAAQRSDPPAGQERTTAVRTSGSNNGFLKSQAAAVGSSKFLLPAFQTMQTAIPGAKLEFFEDAGHAIFVNDAEKFNASLDNFLSSLRQGACR